MRTISEYAASNNLSFVQVYSDEGISGLHIKKRYGLQSLLNDIVRGKANFGVVIVYDTSRWSRFQDPDQSAHYEYLCRMSGVPAWRQRAIGAIALKPPNAITNGHHPAIIT